MDIRKSRNEISRQLYGVPYSELSPFGKSAINSSLVGETFDPQEKPARTRMAALDQENRKLAAENEQLRIENQDLWEENESLKLELLEREE